MLARVLLWFPTLASTVQVALATKSYSLIVIPAKATEVFRTSLLLVMLIALNAVNASVGTAYGSQSCGGESAANTVSLLAVFRVFPTLQPLIRSLIVHAPDKALSGVAIAAVTSTMPSLQRLECGNCLRQLIV